ncbi:hypothetical protein CEB3_c19610 [Peptococcaceae bacterium CEB3]|nr:hypothetical protein CEB3_c19610 [Peptococcaceae bacterium CEB3]
MIDDFAPKSNPLEAEKMRKTAERIIRGYGDRVGRGRLNPDSTARTTYIPRGMGIITAESMIEGGESTVGRVMGIELRKDEVDLKRLTFAQANTERLRLAMTAYIRYVIKNYETLKCRFEQEFPHKMQEVQIEGHTRVSDEVIWLNYGLTIFAEFAVHVGAIDEKEAEALSAEGKQAITTVGEKQIVFTSNEKPAGKFLNIVNELLSSGKVGICSTEMIGPPSKQENLGGWADQDYVYLLPETIYGEVEKFLAPKHSTIGVPPRTLWKDLGDMGILAVTEVDNGREIFTKRKQIGNARHHVLWIKREFISAGFAFLSPAV